MHIHAPSMVTSDNPRQFLIDYFGFKNSVNSQHGGILFIITPAIGPVSGVKKISLVLQIQFSKNCNPERK